MRAVFVPNPQANKQSLPTGAVDAGSPANVNKDGSDSGPTTTHDRQSPVVSDFEQSLTNVPRLAIGPGLKKKAPQKVSSNRNGIDTSSPASAKNGIGPPRLIVAASPDGDLSATEIGNHGIMQSISASPSLAPVSNSLPSLTLGSSLSVASPSPFQFQFSKPNDVTYSFDPPAMNLLARDKRSKQSVSLFANLERSRTPGPISQADQLNDSVPEGPDIDSIRHDFRPPPQSVELLQDTPTATTHEKGRNRRVRDDYTSNLHEETIHRPRPAMNGSVEPPTDTHGERRPRSRESERDDSVRAKKARRDRGDQVQYGEQFSRDHRSSHQSTDHYTVANPDDSEIYAQTHHQSTMIGNQEFAQMFGIDADNFVANHMDAFYAAKKRWTECSMDEWIKGSDELMGKFTELLDFVKNHMQKKMELYKGLQVTLDSHGQVLDERDKILVKTKEQLVKQAVGVVGH